MRRSRLPTATSSSSPPTWHVLRSVQKSWTGRSRPARGSCRSWCDRPTQARSGSAGGTQLDRRHRRPTGPALDAATEALRTDLDHVKAHTRLQVRAGEWERKDDSKALLLRGGEIAEAELVLASDAEPRPTPLQSRFVQASRAASTRRQRSLIGAVAAALVVSLGLSAIALVQRQRGRGERTGGLPQCR